MTLSCILSHLINLVYALKYVQKPFKAPFFVRDTLLSSLESETCCAYRALSVILHYLPQRWNNFLHFTCREKSRQSGDRDELIHKDRWGKKATCLQK